MHLLTFANLLRLFDRVPFASPRRRGPHRCGGGEAARVAAEFQRRAARGAKAGEVPERVRGCVEITVGLLLSVLFRAGVVHLIEVQVKKTSCFFFFFLLRAILDVVSSRVLLCNVLGLFHHFLFCFLVIDRVS